MKKRPVKPIPVDDLRSKLKTIEQIDFEQIKNSFVPPLPRKKQKGKKIRHYKLPRIAWIGYFAFMSMTDQRYFSRQICFEYFDDIEFGTTDRNNLEVLTGKWPDITKAFTRLIVIGIDMGENHINLLGKAYKNASIPVCLAYNIPITTEAEIIKLHLDYPDITINTRWDLKNSIHDINHFKGCKQ